MKENVKTLETRNLANVVETIRFYKVVDLDIRWSWMAFDWVYYLEYTTH